MKKRVGLIAILCIIIFWILCVRFPRHMADSYSSVKIFQFNSTKEFYNFYAPQFYFNHTNKKQTVEDINYIDIWYQGSVDNYYSIVFKGKSFNQEISQKNVEVSYSVSNFTSDEFEKIKAEYEYIDENFDIYYYFNDSHVFMTHNYNDQSIITIGITNNLSEYPTVEKMKSIVYEIMKDSIELNEGSNKKVTK